MVDMGKRLVVFAYGLVSYMVFFMTFLYAVGFIGNLYVPKSMDSAPRISFFPALVIDALLLLTFAVQHSVMATACVQRNAHSIHSGGCRTQHIRALFQLVADRAVRLLAAHWRRDLERYQSRS